MSDRPDIGDYVIVQIGRGTPEKLWVIGYMSYAEDKMDVVLTAAVDAIGMPVNICHCTKTGVLDVKHAMQLRRRYIRLYGEGALVSL